eukprot:c7919_g1_i1.p2 GENE.c7919_g1_i1~~c7919_g1_i1.p2  ORF type:complete len:267 (-),score=40.79 c7919_g1_i1:63-863(-)
MMADKLKNPGLQLDSLDAYFNAPGDLRTSGWLMMSAPWYGWVLVALYLVAVAVGKRAMESRKPFKLTVGLILYNGAMVLLNGYMMVTIAKEAFGTLGYGPVCNAVDYSERGRGLARVLWLFYMSKFIEFLDTIFFVLRKKNEQISFLHIYHHSSMPLIWWMGTKFAAGGESFMSALVNSGVHVILYTYYLLTGLGYTPSWKQLLTQVQIAQFLALMAHALAGLWLCDHSLFPRWMALALLGYMVSMLVLFMNFYLRSYRKRLVKFE